MRGSFRHGDIVAAHRGLHPVSRLDLRHSHARRLHVGSALCMQLGG